METMHAAGRRTLPPVPRPSDDRKATTSRRPGTDASESETPTQRFVVDLTTGERRTVTVADAEPAVDAANDAVAPAVVEPVLENTEPVLEDTAPDRDSAPDTPRSGEPAPDLAQQFVGRLRAAATDFAAAAGAESAVVREAVPPARHRRARCRVVLRYADESEVDVTLLGPAGRPGRPSRHGFDRQIRRWLAAGQQREDAWLVLADGINSVRADDREQFLARLALLLGDRVSTHDFREAVSVAASLH